MSGRNISQFQIDMLLDLGIEELIIATDKQFKEPDSKLAEIDTKYLLRLARRMCQYIRVYVIWDDIGLLEMSESPSDRGRETLEELLRNKKEVLNIE